MDGILTTDLKGKLTYVNRAMEEMLGYARGEILGVHISSFMSGACSSPERSWIF